MYRRRGSGTKPFVYASAAILLMSGMARADECDVRASHFAIGLGATVERRGESGPSRFFLRHPFATGLRFDCYGGSKMSDMISVHIDTAYPTADYFALAADAGAILTGATDLEMRGGSIACHRAALRGNGFSHISRGAVDFECATGAQLTSVSIYRRLPTMDAHPAD